MTGHTGRYIGLFALLCLCAAVTVTVLLVVAYAGPPGCGGDGRQRRFGDCGG